MRSLDLITYSALQYSFSKLWQWWELIRWVLNLGGSWVFEVLFSDSTRQVNKMNGSPCPLWQLFLFYRALGSGISFKTKGTTIILASQYVLQSAITNLTEKKSRKILYFKKRIDRINGIFWYWLLSNPPFFKQPNCIVSDFTQKSLIFELVLDNFR